MTAMRTFTLIFFIFSTISLAYYPSYIRHDLRVRADKNVPPTHDQYLVGKLTQINLDNHAKNLLSEHAKRCDHFNAISKTTGTEMFDRHLTPATLPLWRKAIADHKKDVNEAWKQCEIAGRARHEHKKTQISWALTRLPSKYPWHST
jgi:hypothetical protein